MAVETVVVAGLKVVLKAGTMFGVVKLAKEVGVMEVFSLAITSVIYLIFFSIYYLF